MNDEHTIPAYRCLSCGSAEKYENRAFGSLPRVTSDSVPFTAGGRICICLQCGLIQKIADEKWLGEIATIYNNYQMYELTGGADQPLFAEGGLTRADRLVEILSAHVPPSFAGDVLDIGCGTGGFLKAFGGVYPQASLYGQEIDGRNLPYLKRIANFKTLFTAEASPQGFTFDIIASIHCFEHIYEYATFFGEIETLQKDSGRILLQMPDIESSPFDIVIADHVAHFSQHTLQHCLNRHQPGFSVSKPIHKELTALMPSPLIEPPPAPPPEESMRTLDAYVDYLTRMLSLIEDRQLSEFGVYGTTIAGAWLTAAFCDKIAFYIDDDPLKQGKQFYGKNVVAADNVPKHCKIVMPFGMAAIRKILGNHPGLQSQAVYCDQAMRDAA